MYMYIHLHYLQTFHLTMTKLDCLMSQGTRGETVGQDDRHLLQSVQEGGLQEDQEQHHPGQQEHFKYVIRILYFFPILNYNIALVFDVP